MAAKLGSKAAGPIPFLRLAYSGPEPQRRSSTIEEIRRLLMPATKALPFVKLRANDQPLWRPESYWHVKSTGRRELDTRLGRKYARWAIAAMKADHNPNLIALIVQDIIKESTGKDGKGRARLSPAAMGFLAEISEIAATAC